MTRRILLLLSALLLVACNEEDKGSENTFRNRGNPLFRDAFTADPAPMVASDGRLYVFCGHDQQYDNRPGFEGKDGYNVTEWLCYSTADMQEWTIHGAVLKPSDFSWAEGDACASQCIEVNGKYFFYVSTLSKDPDCKAIGVAVADHPEGPYTDALGKALVLDTMSNNSPQGGWSASAPTVFMDDDGTPWLCWGYGNCFLVRLKRNMTELDGEICALPLENYLEAPWLYKHGGRYYLAYSSMGTGRENISYSVAGSIQGPWDYKGPLTGMAEDSYTIHPGIVDFDGKSYLFYHNETLSLDGYGPATGRRSVCVDELMYTADGSIRPVEQTRAGVSEY